MAKLGTGWSGHRCCWYRTCGGKRRRNPSWLFRDNRALFGRAQVLSAGERADQKIKFLLVLSGKVEELKAHPHRVIGSFDPRPSANHRIAHAQHKDHFAIHRQRGNGFQITSFQADVSQAGKDSGHAFTAAKLSSAGAVIAGVFSPAGYLCHGWLQQ